MAEKIKFSENSLKKLLIPGAKRMTYYDSETKYLALLVNANGNGSYYYIRAINRKTSFICLGESAKTTIQEARQLALNCTWRILQNLPPIEQPAAEEKQESPKLTLRFAHDTWIAARLARGDEPRNVSCCASRFEKYCPAKMQKAEISTLRRADFQELLYATGPLHGERTANSLIIGMKAAINYLIKMEYEIPRNPAAKIDMYQEKERSRFIRAEEMKIFFDELEKSESEDFRDFVKLAIYTGKRKENVLDMRWSWIDWTRQLLTLPAEKEKNDEEDVTVLDIPAWEILERRRADQLRRNIKTDFVFYSPQTRTGRYQEPRKSWITLRERAGMPDLRIHDLRRTLGSWMAANGESEITISKALGQKTTSATHIYARQDVAPRRIAVSRAVSQIRNAAGLEDDTTAREKLDRMLDADPRLAERLLNLLQGSNVISNC